MTENAAADDAREQRGGSDDGQDEADAGPLLAVLRAQLVLLDLALLVEDEDADRAELDLLSPGPKT